MRLNRLLALAGVAAIAAARALPANVSISDGIVQTAGFDPNSLASDDLWDKYQKKGDHFQCLFVADDEAAGRLTGDTRTPPSAQSIWNGNMYAERELWNWHQNYFDEDNCNAKHLHLTDAFEAIGLSTVCEEDDGHNQGWALGHYDENRMDPDAGPYDGMLAVIRQTYQVGTKTYKSTGGYYSFVVNQNDGLIAALDISSPRNAVKDSWRSIGGTASPEDLPALQYASDLMWGKWVEGNPNVKNLKWYMAHGVINVDTSLIVPRAMRNKLVTNISLWPGTLFNKDKDVAEFQALIGSPIGGTIAIMLIQHKEELGNKEIYEVNIVTDEWSSKPNRHPEVHIFFHIRDVPEDKEDNNPTDDGAK